MSRPPTTAERSPRRGLDERARKALVRALVDARTDHDRILHRFLREEAYADFADYFEAVREVEGDDAFDAMRSALDRLMNDAIAASGRPAPSDRLGLAQTLSSFAVLIAMPEGDFLTALELGAATATEVYAVALLPNILNQICDRRGVPYSVSGVGRLLKFEWVGEPSVHEQAVAPALGALDDPQLAGGPRSEFLQARKELREGSPQALKQAVAEACNAVESTMKVLLDARQVTRPARENAQDLFGALLDRGLVGKEAEELVLSASRFGNRRGRHGAGAAQHAISAAEAQAVVAAAATSIALLASELP